MVVRAAASGSAMVKRGRPPRADTTWPPKHEDVVEMYFDDQMKWKEIQLHYGTSRKTLDRWKAQNWHMEKLAGDALVDELRKLQAVDPNTLRGARTIMAHFLKSHKKVSYADALQAMEIMDPAAFDARRRRVIYRRRYISPGVNHTWHLDTWHKGIAYGIVVAGAIDGFSRYIPYLSVANNNRASSQETPFVGEFVQSAL